MSCMGRWSSARGPTVAFLAVPALCLVLLAATGASVAQDKAAADASKAASEPAKPRSSLATPARLDLYGDPIPAGAVVRLGTVRFRGEGEDRYIVFSADGNSLITAGSGKVYVWETRTGKLLREHALAEKSLESIRAFALSPDGKTAAVFGSHFDADRRDFVVWLAFLDVTTGRQQARIDMPRSRSGGSAVACFTPDGTTLIAAAEDGTTSVWDVATRQEILQFKVPGRGIHAADVSPDGKLVALSGREGIYLWPWTTGEQPIKLALKRRDQWGMAVRFSPDGKLLAIGDRHEIAVHLWDLQAGRVTGTLAEEEQAFSVDSMAFTPDGKTLATAPARPTIATPPSNRDKSVLLWDTRSGKVARRLDAAPIEPRWLAISRDGRWLATADWAGTRKKVWDLASGDEVGREAVGHEATVTGVQFSPDGRTVVTASDDGTVRTWDATTGRQQRVLQHDYWVRGAAVSPDGKWIASNSLDNTVRLWDMATGKEVYRLPGHGRSGGRRPVAFTPDSRRLYSWGDDDDAYLRVWDVATGKAIREFAICPSDVKAAEKDPNRVRRPAPFDRWTMMSRDAAFSADGKLFAVPYARSVYFFDVETGQEIRKLPIAVGGPFAISPDGKQVAATASGSQAKAPSGPLRSEAPPESSLVLLDFASGKEAWSQPLPGGFHGQLAFSPDGKRLLVGMNMDPPNNQIRVLDAATGKTSRTIENVPRMGWSGSLVLSPDDKRLASAVNSTVLVWDLPKTDR